jgi:hypothetical protein
MSIRSSELDDERLGERYTRRSTEEDDPFNSNEDVNAARNSNEDSLFPSENEDDGNVDDNNVNEESEGNAGFPQRRDEIPQAIDTTTHHGHATRARTRIRLQGDESVASSRTPRNSAFAPIAPTFSPPAHNPPPNTVFATGQAARSPSQIDYGRIAPSQGRVAHVGYSAIREALDKMDQHTTNDERIKGELNWQKSIASLRPEQKEFINKATQLIDFHAFVFMIKGSGFVKMGHTISKFTSMSLATEELDGKIFGFLGDRRDHSEPKVIEIPAKYLSTWLTVKANTDPTEMVNYYLGSTVDRTKFWFGGSPKVNVCVPNVLGRIGTYSLSGRWTDDRGEPNIHGECVGEALEWRD